MFETKEELKQEAKNYAEENKMDMVDYHDSLFMENAYLAGAEPREKRIAELERENAELRHQLNKNPCVCNTEWHCNDCLDRLIKAKELIKEIIINKAVIKVYNPYADDGTVKSLEIALNHWLQRAEHFLNSEVEK